MNYQKIYDKIINNAKDRKLECYTEKHHIIPKCLGGSNDKSNLVRLTAKEHFIVHWLLVKINPDEKKLVYALNCFLMNNKGLRKGSNLISYALGSNNPMYGKSFYEIWLKKYGRDEADKRLLKMKNRCSLSMKGRVPWNKGLTKDTDERIKQYGIKQSKTKRYLVH